MPDSSSSDQSPNSDIHRVTDLNRAIGYLQALKASVVWDITLPEKRKQVIQHAIDLIEPHSHYPHD